VQQLPFRVLSQSTTPLCLRAPLFHARAAAHAMASLSHPDCFQAEEELNLVRGLLGWSTPGLAGRIRASAIPLGNLTAGEFVLFTSYISCGLALPICPSSCCWRSSGFSFNTSRPTPSSRQRFSSTSARCL
jgi:hypothetical protein